jgi:hypothetical protein
LYAAPCRLGTISQRTSRRRCWTLRITRSVQQHTQPLQAHTSWRCLPASPTCSTEAWTSGHPVHWLAAWVNRPCDALEVCYCFLQQHVQTALQHWRRQHCPQPVTVSTQVEAVYLDLHSCCYVSVSFASIWLLPPTGLDLGVCEPDSPADDSGGVTCTGYL